MSVSSPFTADDLAELEAIAASGEVQVHDGEGPSVWEQRVNAVIEMLNDGEISEDSWRELVSADNMALIKCVALVMTWTELGLAKHPFGGKLCQCLQLLSTLNPKPILTACWALPQCPEALCDSIMELCQFDDKDNDTIGDDLDRQLIPRLALLQSFIIHVPHSELLEGLGDLDALLNSLLASLACTSSAVFDAALDSLLLLHQASCRRRQNTLVLEAALRSEHASEFSQGVLQLLNKQSELRPLQISAALSFCEQVFRQAAKQQQESKSSEDVPMLFYVNDIYVLLDVLMRLIFDSNKEDPLVLDLVTLLQSVIVWPGYTDQVKSYKSADLAEAMQALVEACQRLTTENDEAILVVAEPLLKKLKELSA